MTVRELINKLLDHSMKLDVYVGKGMGPLGEPVAHYGPEVAWLVLSPDPDTSDE